MTTDLSSDDRQAFPSFPVATTANGKDRLTGIEIEFAGIDEKTTATLIAAELGGRAEAVDTMAWRVSGTALGDIGVELDTALRKQHGWPLLKEGIEALRGIVPVEIVSPPLDRAGVIQLDRFCCETLRPAGALGSRNGVLLGFGVHLNPEVPALAHPHTLAVISAYALIEPWLRAREDLDMTRRALPFVDPWPQALVDDLAAAPPTTLGRAMALYARHVQSRNHSLDLFPLFKHADPQDFARLFPGQDSGARPAFHFRMPDCRIDEPQWSLGHPWALWHHVERLAARPGALDELRSAWLGHRDRWLSMQEDWIARVDQAMGPVQPEGAS